MNIPIGTIKKCKENQCFTWSPTGFNVTNRFVACLYLFVCLCMLSCSHHHEEKTLLNRDHSPGATLSGNNASAIGGSLRLHVHLEPIFIRYKICEHAPDDTALEIPADVVSQTHPSDEAEVMLQSVRSQSRHVGTPSVLAASIAALSSRPSISASDSN